MPSDRACLAVADDGAATLHDVAADLQAGPGREATLYIFSDMLQSNRSIDMEGLHIMPPPGWVDREKANGTLPDLTGLCVYVIGARVDTRASQQVKDFWEEYFAATGAALVKVNRSPCTGPGFVPVRQASRIRTRFRGHHVRHAARVASTTFKAGPVPTRCSAVPATTGRTTFRQRRA
mgnify:CR=1 FL=1